MELNFSNWFNGQNWNENGQFTISDEGKILSVQSKQFGVPDQDVLIPGFINAHSHAFQYAMAGMAEMVTGKKDTFWTWRDKMYQLALNLSPDQIQDIAAMLYAEMARNGYTHVVEFHYLHHQPNGMPYENKAEIGVRLMEAAKIAGIGITLVPMCYMQGGFGKMAESHQRRFISKSTDDYFEIVEAALLASKSYKHATVAYGVHSLRAVTGEDLVNVYNRYKGLPFHIHISEQLAEVEDCVAFTGLRPVEFLMSKINIDSNVHLVHATHLTDKECSDIAESGAHVVLCPSTEGNLGDGIFPFRRFLELNGKWSIGSDSHVTLSFMEELKWLDYGQRLISNRRDTFLNGGPSFGQELFAQSLRGGKIAAGLNQESGMVVGDFFTGLMLNEKHPMSGSMPTQTILNGLIYSGDVTSIKKVWHGGVVIVEGGIHKSIEEIHLAYVKTIKELRIRS